MKIEDGEIGQLFWNCLARYKGDETNATLDIKKKYLKILLKPKICI